MKRGMCAAGMAGVLALAEAIPCAVAQTPNVHVWEGTNNKSPQLPKCPRPGAIHYTVTINDANNQAVVMYIGTGAVLLNREFRLTGPMNPTKDGKRVGVLTGPGGKMQMTVTRVSPEAITLTHAMDNCFHSGDMTLKR